MKNLAFIFCFLYVVCLSVSCNKEISPENSGQNSISTGNSDDLLRKPNNPPASTTTQTNFGVLVNDVSGNDKITVVNKLQVKYVRNTIVLKQFNGNAPMQNTYDNNNLVTLLNLNYDVINKDKNGNPLPGPFPTDMNDYTKKLKSVLNVYTPQVVVIENEPFNDSRYYSDVSGYVNELTTAINVCKSYNVKVADGGLKGERICILTYRDYVNRGMQKEADDFANRALSPKNLRVAQGKGTADAESKVDETANLIANYKKLALDYVNLHWYEPFTDVKGDPNASASGVLQEVADYLRRATGKEVITNEFGQNNNSPDLVSSLVTALRAAGFKYAIDFSGSGKSGAVALNNGTTLKSNGIAYRDNASK